MEEISKEPGCVKIRASDDSSHEVAGRDDAYESQLSLTSALLMAEMKIDLLKKPPHPKTIPGLALNQYFKGTQLLEMRIAANAVKNKACTLNPRPTTLCESTPPI